VSIDPAIKAQLRQTAYYKRQTGTSAYGDPSWPTDATAFTCRVESRPKRVLSALGEEVVSDVQLVTEAAIDVRDRIWPPGADRTVENEARVPKMVAKAFNEDGTVSHYEVAL
jgi:hypothetical protein